MRIAFLVNNYPPHVGGLEMHVHALACALRGRGHDVTVVALSDSPGESDEEDMHVIRLRERFRIADVLAFPPLGTARRLRQMLRDGGFDLVSVHTRFFPMTWLGVDAARACGIPVVVTEHGSGYVASNSPIIAVASRIVDLTFGRRALRRASHVIGVSENAVAFVKRLSGAEAEVFYNAIDLPAQAPETPARNPKHLVFVGRLVPGKGWEAFMETVTQLRAKGFDVTGSLLGNGPDEEAARRAAPDGVTVHGRVSPAEVGVQLRGATLVNPTVLSEGFQTTLLEALAAGGQVVTYPVPGAQVLADDGAPVMITDRRDQTSLRQAVEAVLDDPGEPYPWPKLEKWSWRNRAAQFEAIAAELIRAGQ